MIGIKINDKKNLSIDKIDKYLEPKEIKIKFKKDSKILVKEKDSIKKGEELGTEGTFNVPKHSSVSGKITKIDTLENYIEITIENDFKETLDKNILKEKRNLEQITKEEFLEIINKCGITGMGGAGFPTYIKYSTDKAINTLIVNAVECEPYITSDYTVGINHMDEIIKTLKKIMELFKIKECYIAVKNKNYKLNEKIITKSDSYKKITIVEVPHLYPMGWEKSLVRYIKHTDYEKLPIEKGVVVSNITTIYKMYEALTYNMPVIERFVTFSGENLSKPTNVELKIGTNIKEVIDYIGGTKKENSTFISGGPMMGSNIDINSYITRELNCILALDYHEPIPMECLRCGKCINNCPAKLAPVLIKDNINDTNELKKLCPEKCISCGICTFVCPSKINVREIVALAKEKTRGVK